MRFPIAAFVLVLAGCSPPSGGAPAPPSASAAPAPSEASATTEAAVTPEALGGQWSFDGTCGMYDLVFTNTGANYYDYADPSNVVSWDGTYAVSGGRVEMTLHRLDAHGAPTNPAQMYTLDVIDLQGDTLTGRLSYVQDGGAIGHTFTAKRCDNAEDRE